MGHVVGARHPQSRRCPGAKRVRGGAIVLHVGSHILWRRMRRLHPLGKALVACGAGRHKRRKARGTRRMRQEWRSMRGDSRGLRERSGEVRFKVKRGSAVNNVLIALTVAAAILAGQPAFAQSGSTGGSIGKTEKSISGDQESNAPDARPRRQRVRGSGSGEESGRGSSCRARITGQWKWHMGNTISIGSGGGFTSSNGLSGHWSCSGNSITIKWSTGITDWLKLSDNGSSMSGTNNWGVQVSARR